MAWGMKNYTIQLFGSSIIEGRIGVERAADDVCHHVGDLLAPCIIRKSPLPERGSFFHVSPPKR